MEKIDNSYSIKPVAPIEKTKKVEWERQELDERKPDDEEEEDEKKDEPEKDKDRIIDIWA